MHLTVFPRVFGSHILFQIYIEDSRFVWKSACSYQYIMMVHATMASQDSQLLSFQLVILVVLYNKFSGIIITIIIRTTFVSLSSRTNWKHTWIWSEINYLGKHWRVLQDEIPTSPAGLTSFVTTVLPMPQDVSLISMSVSGALGGLHPLAQSYHNKSKHWLTHCPNTRYSVSIVKWGVPCIRLDRAKGR